MMVYVGISNKDSEETITNAFSAWYILIILGLSSARDTECVFLIIYFYDIMVLCNSKYYYYIKNELQTTRIL